MKIYAPVKDANGVYASVRFVNGVGETDNPRLIEWFKTHGYKVPIEDSVEKCENSPDIRSEKCDQTEDKPDFESMTPFELREWMVANGYNIRNTRSKEKLLEILRG